MIAVRFDDSLKTVLSADMSSGVGARSAWRQLVDLLSRDRIPADAATIDRLRALRDAVPLDVRAASGRALAFAAPGAALVALFAEDEIAVAARRAADGDVGHVGMDRNPFLAESAGAVDPASSPRPARRRHPGAGDVRPDRFRACRRHVQADGGVRAVGSPTDPAPPQPIRPAARRPSCLSAMSRAGCRW